MKKSVNTILSTSTISSACFKTNAKKALALSVALSLAACSSSEQPALNQQGHQQVTAATVESTQSAKPVAQRMVTGSVSGDTSISANQSLDLVWNDGVVSNIATTDANGRYQITLPSDVELPVIIELNNDDPEKVLKVLVGRIDSTSELTPMSTLVVDQLVGEYAKGQGVNALNRITEQDIAASAQNMVDKVFGSGLTQSDMATNTDLNNVLMTALKNMSEGKSVLDIITSAVNGTGAEGTESAIGGNLLTNPAFQTLLAGAFASQDFSAADVMSLLSGTSIDAEVVEQAAQNSASFDDVKALAENSDVNADVVNTIVEEASKAVSDVVKNTDQNDLSNLLGQVLETVSPALVDMVTQTLPADMNNEQVSEVVKAAADQAGKILNEQAGDNVENLSQDQFDTIKDQLGDVAKLVGGPVADVLLGNVLNNLSDEQTSAVVDTIGANLGSIAGAFIDQLGQGALPQEALDQATLAATPVAETIGNMLIEETVKNAAPEIISNLIQTVGQVSLEQITQDNAQNTDASAMVEVLNVVAGALTGANLNTNQAVEQATAADQSQVVVDTLTQAASALIEMTQQGSVDAEDTASGANLIENVVNTVLPTLINTASNVAPEKTAPETEPAPAVTPTVPAPFTLIVDGEETTVGDAIANAAQDFFTNLGQQAFGSLFGQNTSES